MNFSFCHDKFWDLNITWNVEVPDFTSCFQNSMLILMPCIIFSLFSLKSMCHITRNMNPAPLPWSPLNTIKVVTCIILIVLCVFNMGVEFQKKVLDLQVIDSELLSSCMKAITFVITLILMLVHKAYGVRTSTLLSLFWLCFSLCGIVVWRSSILRFLKIVTPADPEENFVIDMIYFPLIYLQLFLSCFADVRTYTSLERVSPFDDEPFFSYLTFSWFNGIIRKGLRRQLTVQDFVPLCLRQKSSYLWGTFKSKWSLNLVLENQLFSPTSSQKPPSLAWTLTKAFWPWIVWTFILNICYDFMTLISPLILNLVIDFISSSESVWKGYFYCMLIVLTDFITRMVLNHFLFFAVAIGGQVKGALTEAVYRKCLRISNTTRGEYPSGSLTNLVSVDVQRIVQFSMFFGNMVAAPLKIVLTMTLLWQYLGPSSLSGVIVIALLMPLTLWSSRAIAKLFEKQMKMKDLRLKDLNEILAGIKILKLYAWEVPFMEKISDIRNKELRLTLICQFCYVAIELIFSCAPILVAIASFTTYLLIDKTHVLSPSTAFVSLNLMSILKYSLFEVPDTISELMQTNVSLGRIRKFLLTEEYDPDVVGSNPETGEDLTINDATFSWTHDSEPTLKNISLNVKEGSLVAVVGPVGSGKSSLLSAALSEMYKISGSINMKGSLAYVPQQAWILNRTLKQNILLENSLNEQMYDEVVECCCLKPDLEILPGGDKTEIGEKGINLSGGQKQRISLARAVFQNADVYLLDDPLSAVDSHVRKDLFENVIGHSGLLRNKTRILVTHDISILSRCDTIVSMKDGKIDEMGTYSELLNRCGSFAEFLQEHSNQDVAEVEHKDSLNQSGANQNSIEFQMDPIGDVDISSKQIQYEEEQDNFGIKLTEEEKMEIGKVNRGVYINYVKHGSILMFVLGIFGIVIFEAFEIGGNIWLSEWSNDASVPNATENASLRTLRLSVYGVLGLAQVFASVVGSSFLVLASLRAAKIYHSNMLQSVIKSPMSFFDTTPFGRIINRFSADMDIIDVNIVYDIDGWLKCLVAIIGIFIVVGINLPIFFASLIPVMFIYYIIQKLYLNTSRQLKRLESVSKSPIFSHMLESIHGISSIKAYQVEKQFTEKLESHLDIHLSCYFQSMSCNRWLAFWLSLLGDAVVTVACILAVQNRGVLSASVVGLTITYAISVTQSLLWLVRCNTQLENKSVSVERLEEYCHLSPEAPWNIPDCDPSYEWPESGRIKFEEYSTRYREGLDLVLNKVDLEVESNEKVGIVGRTGAGKSSITLALFRILESSTGRIVIDNLDVSKIGLHSLRSKLTIIPQDPVLFTGSIRHNLDPNNEYDDDQIWQSLKQSHLKDFVSNLSDGLNYNITEGGGNLSVGQRQLVCLSRALLKRTKILVLDEATAAVDMDTDKLIQNTIRTEFQHHTVITIAHRLNTILDYDKIIVMDAGGVSEVGNPTVLLQDPETKFYSMAKDAKLL